MNAPGPGVRRVCAICLLFLIGVVPQRAIAQTQGATPQNVAVVLLDQGRLFRLDHDATHVLIADSRIADVQVISPRLVYVYGRQVGQTTLHATSAEDNVLAALTIRVERSGAAARADLLRNGVPSAPSVRQRAPIPLTGLTRGPVDLRFIGNQLVVEGPVANLGEAMQVEGAAKAYAAPNLPPLDLTQLAGTQQITLRVRIAEVDRQDMNNLGINWNVMAQPGSFLIGFFTNSVISSFSQAVSAGTSFGSLGFGFQNNRVNANVLINALEQEQIITMLAEPNLTTVSGQTANFLAGGEVPIPVPQSFGVTTIEYKPYGVSLAFTPTLLPGGRIALRVRPEVSEINNNVNITIDGNTVPSFTDREAETNVELASGQTIAIGGLFQNNLSDQVQRLPFLGKLPVIGALFRNTTFQRNQLELLILVTPYLSKPMNTPDTPLPTDDSSALRSRPSALSHAGFVVN